MMKTQHWFYNSRTLWPKLFRTMVNYVHSTARLKMPARGCRKKFDFVAFGKWEDLRKENRRATRDRREKENSLLQIVSHLRTAECAWRKGTGKTSVPSWEIGTPRCHRRPQHRPHQLRSLKSMSHHWRWSMTTIWRTSWWLRTRPGECWEKGLTC